MRSLLTPGALVRIAIAGVIGVAIWVGIDAWIADRTNIEVDLPGFLPGHLDDRPITLLSPVWLHIVAVVPVFYLLRVLSLTDLSIAQQVFQSTLRSLVVAGFAIALARPSWVTQTSKVATIALVDVSDSISDKQLAAAKAYVDQLDADAAKHDGTLQLVTFAEKPLAIHRDDATAKPSDGVKRHVGAGAGTDVQAAMQLAYGMFPDGFLPRMVMITDGNQTAGDMAVEAYRAKELGVHVSWKTFDADKVDEVRVVGVTVPDDVKVGQPYEVTAEVWTTEAQKVTLTLQQDEFPNPLEPSKSLDLREGKNLIKFKSDAKHAGSTTYTLRLTKNEHDTEKNNNQAVMTAPVKGRPNVLYVEGGILREPGQAGHLQRALEHENIDVQVRGPTGIPSNPKELEKYDLILVSDVPAHLMGAGQMAALDAYVKAGGGLIMAGGEDSFGSGGYERTMIETMMPVRFESERVKDQPDIALALVIDRSGSMQGQKLEMAKESARVTTEVLSPCNDYITVIAFDSEATLYVPPTRASNRMRISNEIARLNAGGGTNIYPGLKMAYEQLSGINAKVKHVILMTDGEAPTDGLADLVGEMHQSRITVSCVGVPGADRNMLAMISEAGEGRLYMVEDIGSLPKIFMKETQEAQKRPASSRTSSTSSSPSTSRRSRARTSRQRAGAARLRVHQAQADLGDHPDRDDRRADPVALALGRRHVGGVDQRRQEPVERRLGALGRLLEVLGAGRALVDVRRKVSTTATTCSRRSRTAARRSPSTRSTPWRPLRQRARHRPAGHRPGDQQDRRRRCRWSRPPPAATPPDFKIQRYGSY